MALAAITRCALAGCGTGPIGEDTIGTTRLPLAREARCAEGARLSSEWCVAAGRAARGQDLAWELTLTLQHIQGRSPLSGEELTVELLDGRDDQLPLVHGPAGPLPERMGEASAVFRFAAGAADPIKMLVLYRKQADGSRHQTTTFKVTLDLRHQGIIF
jgi:hypothetical protein